MVVNRGTRDFAFNNRALGAEKFSASVTHDGARVLPPMREIENSEENSADAPMVASVSLALVHHPHTRVR
jgi:hypothetical protein